MTLERKIFVPSLPFSKSEDGPGRARRRTET